MALEGLQLWSRRLLGVLLSGETEAWTAMVGGNQHALADATDRDGAVLTNGGERRNTDHLNKGLDPKYHLFLSSDTPSYSSFLCHPTSDADLEKMARGEIVGAAAEVL